MIKIVRKVAPSNSTVLIQGESGTGKEVIARAIHRLSPRGARPFVAINCSAMPDTLIENELFGHERGAFTGATERKIGLIESADKSTLFLDEIGDLGIGGAGQAAARAAGARGRRVGGNESFHVDVRLIAATNHNLAEEVAEERFREDLYYRVNVVTITLPPLRDRRSDIPLLANQRWAASAIWRAGGSRRSAARRWKCCSTTRGRATCASSNRRLSGRSCYARATRSCRATCRRRCSRARADGQDRALARRRSLRDSARGDQLRASRTRHDSAVDGTVPTG